MATMPPCSPLGPTRRTSGTRKRSFMRGPVLLAPAWRSSVDRALGETGLQRKTPAACARGRMLRHGLLPDPAYAGTSDRTRRLVVRPDKVGENSACAPPE